MTTEYEGVSQELLQHFKFNRAQAAADILAKALDDTLPHSPQTVITHVPTASSRVRQRGYDQSRLMARRLSGRRSVKCATLLTRSNQVRQVGATRKQRFIQLADAFRVAKPSLVSGRSILLIDDVLTTGATIEAAAKSLKAAGAKQVNAAIFAQKH